MDESIMSNRIRTGLILTGILSFMFAAVSLLDSLYWFGIWAAVSAGSFIAQDVVAHVDHRNWRRDMAKQRHPSSWDFDAQL
jgi:hypothetical protein